MELKELTHVLENLPDNHQLLKIKSEKELELLTIKNSIGRYKEKLAQFLRFPDLKNIPSENVYGSVASLLYLPENNRQWSNALETCAGGRLYNLVVESEIDASRILQTPSNRSRRITILPLSRIQGRTISKSILQKISQKTSLFPNSIAVPATSLIQPKMAKFNSIIDFIFGSIVVTDNKELAQLLAFDKSIGVKCITIDGDIYDPSGTMTGGAKTPSTYHSTSNFSILGSFSEYFDLLGKINLEQDFFEQNVNIPLQKRSNVISLIENKKSQISSVDNSLESLNESFIKDPHSIALKRLETDILDLEASQKRKEILLSSIEELQERLSKLSNEHQSLSIDTPQESKIQYLTKEILDLKPQKLSLQKEINLLKNLVKQEELNKTILEERRLLDQKTKSDLQTQLKDSKSQLNSLNENIFSLENLQISANDALLKLNIEFTSLKEKDQKLKESLNQLDTQIIQNHSLTNKLNSDMESSRDSVRSITISLKELSKENPKITTMISANISKSDLISHINSIHLKISELKDKISKKSAAFAIHSSKNNDSSLIQMIDSLERQEVQLEKNLTRVKQDKQKIESAIEKLNNFREDALKETFFRVNKDFGEIIGILLPQSFAELVINPESKSISEGVIIRVRFGSVWKNSLGELSGGQK